VTDAVRHPLVAAVERLRAEADALLSPAPGEPPPPGRMDLPVLARATRSVASRAVAAIVDGTRPGDRAELADLLERAEVLHGRVCSAGRAASIADRDRFEHALRELRACASMAELMERLAPVLREACDAERVSVGIVDDGAWTPIREADRRSGAGPAVSYVPPRDLADLAPERAAFTSGRPTVVEASDGQDGAPPRPAGVIVPTFVGGRARGLFRAEFRGAAPTADGIVAIERLGRALGHVFEMLEMHERLHSVDRTVERLRDTVGVRAPGDEADPAAQALGAFSGDGPSRHAQGTSAEPVPSSDLTPRQRQTLELMLLGLSNAQIAERLVVGVPTVKSHVSAILRAVGAVNRAEAIGRYLERTEE
jgi:DNA-binding CsgD family transcriptional regulator